MHLAGRPAAVATTILFALSLAGCGGSSSSAATTAAAPSATTPAAAVSKAPASSAAPAGGVAEPTEKLTTADGRVIVHPPGWWTKEDMGIVYVATNAKTADSLVLSGTVGPGESYVQFGQNSILPGGTTDPAVHLSDNMKMLIEGQAMTAGTPVAITVVGKPAAKMSASNDRLQLIAVTVKARDDMFADVIAYGAPGEEAALEELVLKMVEVMTFPAP